MNVHIPLSHLKNWKNLEKNGKTDACARRGAADRKSRPGISSPTLILYNIICYQSTIFLFPQKKYLKREKDIGKNITFAFLMENVALCMERNVKENYNNLIYR